MKTLFTSTIVFLLLSVPAHAVQLTRKLIMPRANNYGTCEVPNLAVASDSMGTIYWQLRPLDTTGWHHLRIKRGQILKVSMDVPVPGFGQTNTYVFQAFGVRDNGVRDCQSLVRIVFVKWDSTMVWK